MTSKYHLWTNGMSVVRNCLYFYSFYLKLHNQMELNLEGTVPWEYEIEVDILWGWVIWGVLKG